MYFREYEDEICITDLIAGLLKASKPILCIALAFAIISGLLGVHKAYDAAKHPEVKQEDIVAAEKALKDAEDKQKDAEKALKNLPEIDIPDAEKKVARARQLVQRR